MTLRYGWTTGACAAAATKAAYTTLLTDAFIDQVQIELPRGQKPIFSVTYQKVDSFTACAGILKDAGDDPDVTHRTLIVSTIQNGPLDNGVTFQSGPGVGTITLPGLPLPVGSPAINPGPQSMIRRCVDEVAQAHGVKGDVIVTLSIPGGESLAEKTWNPRLGIQGGLSILGTTGIVIPYSCSAWIHSIHRGVDVARAQGLSHIGAATGKTSENALQRFYDLPDYALIDMGDFVGGLLKYLRGHPIPYLTIAGGFAKITKLGQGNLDLHSSKGVVDLDWIVALADSCSVEQKRALKTAYSANHALTLLQENDLSSVTRAIALAALERVQTTLSPPSKTTVDLMIVDRNGQIIAHVP